MNFFERQDQARRKSALLLFYFLLAVVLIVLAVNLIVWLILDGMTAPPQSLEQWLGSQTFWMASLITLAVILVGSLARYLRLRSGGDAVARMVGATPVNLQSKDARVRQFINVVEEMSIAAGVVMPRLYVMEQESAINAFVAGYQPNQAIMAVTRGALEQLDREELQGVVGHEFSHILNGDMRLNVHLIAVLAGILAIGQVGRFLLRSSHRSSRGSRGKNNGAPALAIGGLGLMLVGYIGLFFGRLIKASVSRQREFLADASAVQFTRNPQGLASALYRIQALTAGSYLTATLHAEDLNHMCFGEATALRFQSLFASHPPLADRIKSIDPLFMPKARSRRNSERLQAQQPVNPTHSNALGALGAVSLAAAMNAPRASGAASSALVEQVGAVQPVHYDYAVRLHQSWPLALQDLTHSPGGAALVVAAVLMTDLDARQQAQALDLLRTRAAELTLPLTAIEPTISLVAGLGLASRLPLVEISLASLKQFEADERERFSALVEDLIKLDQRYTLFEFVVATLLRRQLAPRAGRANKGQIRSFAPVLGDIQQLIAVLARCGGDDRSSLEQTYRQAMRNFTHEPLALPAHCRLSELNRVLGRLAQLTPLLKAPLLQACADVVLQDGKIQPAEYELLRCVAEVLECPLPPLVAGV